MPDVIIGIKKFNQDPPQRKSRGCLAASFEAADPTQGLPGGRSKRGRCDQRQGVQTSKMAIYWAEGITRERAEQDKTGNMVEARWFRRKQSE